MNVLDPAQAYPKTFGGASSSSSRVARTAPEAGAGLGLAIARSYARAHGGDLVYHAEESGVRFELILPAELS